MYHEQAVHSLSPPPQSVTPYCSTGWRIAHALVERREGNMNRVATFSVDGGTSGVTHSALSPLNQAKPPELIACAVAAPIQLLPIQGMGSCPRSSAREGVLSGRGLNRHGSCCAMTC